MVRTVDGKLSYVTSFNQSSSSLLDVRDSLADGLLQIFYLGISASFLDTVNSDCWCLWNNGQDPEETETPFHSKTTFFENEYPQEIFDSLQFAIAVAVFAALTIVVNIVFIILSKNTKEFAKNRVDEWFDPNKETPDMKFIQIRVMQFLL